MGAMWKEEKNNMKSSVWRDSTRFLWQTLQLGKWLAGQVHCYTLSSSPSSCLYLSLHPPVLGESSLVLRTPETELTRCQLWHRHTETERGVLKLENNVAKAGKDEYENERGVEYLFCSRLQTCVHWVSVVILDLENSSGQNNLASMSTFDGIKWFSSADCSD